jgi:DNA-binding transcriptional ArsR family regulator
MRPYGPLRGRDHELSTALAVVRAASCCGLTVTQLASRFSVTRSAISQHLGMLAEVGLVTARKQGRERYYRLDERGVRQLRALFESFWSDEPGHHAPSTLR